MPILKGRRISKLRPEFVIMDPKMDNKTGGLTPYRGLYSEKCPQCGLYIILSFNHKRNITYTYIGVMAQVSEAYISRSQLLKAKTMCG